MLPALGLMEIQARPATTIEIQLTLETTLEIQAGPGTTIEIQTRSEEKQLIADPPCAVHTPQLGKIHQFEIHHL